MTDSDQTRPGVSEHQGLSWSALILGVVAVSACLFGLAGLSASGFSTDELFTLYLIDHHGGLAEVFRRALTDTHPPDYYFLLYGWSRLFGLSEAALRLPSALFCMGAVAILAAGARGAFTLQGRLFAAAVAAASWFWFIESQNVRNYALCLLTSAVLLDLSVRARVIAGRGRPVPIGVMLGLFATGLIGSFAHFYELLVTGMTFLFLILTIPQTRFRLAVMASGVVILALSLGYIRILLGHTQQDIHHMWFRADLPFILGVLGRGFRYTIGAGSGLAALILAAIAIRRARRRDLPATPSEGRWTSGLCLFVPVGVFACGVAISLLLAPSISSQNVLVASPFLWGLVARLYDLGRPDPARRYGAALTVLVLGLTAAELRLQPSRWLDVNEAWRASAGYVQSLPACRGQVIPVVQPPKFGPDTPFFRALTEHNFFGWYVRPGAVVIRAFNIGAFTGTADPALLAIDRPRVAAPGACPVLAWAVHDIDPRNAPAIARGLERTLGLAHGAVHIHEIDSYPLNGLAIPAPRPTGFVFEAPER